MCIDDHELIVVEINDNNIDVIMYNNLAVIKLEALMLKSGQQWITLNTMQHCLKDVTMQTDLKGEEQTTNSLTTGAFV